MAFISGRGHEALRRGRWSAPGAEYFITLCTHDRRKGLTKTIVWDEIMAGANRLEGEGGWRLRTLVVMPDHVHLLVMLGDSGDLTERYACSKGD